MYKFAKLASWKNESNISIFSDLPTKIWKKVIYEQPKFRFRLLVNNV